MIEADMGFIICTITQDRDRWPMCVDIRNNLLSRMLVFTERRMGERGVRTEVVMRHGHSSQLRRPRVTCHHPGPVTSRESLLSVLMSSGPGNTRATPPTPGHVGRASGVPCFVFSWPGRMSFIWSFRQKSGAAQFQFVWRCVADRVMTG